VESALAHRVAMRRLLAEHGVAQPAFAAIRTLHEGRAAVDMVGLPAVLRPATGDAHRGVFVLESTDDLERHLHATLAESPTQEAILERPAEGVSLVAVVWSGRIELAESSQSPGIGWFAPTRLFGDRLATVEDAAERAVRVLRLDGGTACVELLAGDDAVQVLDVLASEPRRELAELLLAANARPAAVRLLTGPPGPLPAGRVRRVGTLDKALAFPGVATVVVDVAVGDVVEANDSESHGYVLANGPTNLQAVERAEAAARLVDVEVW
jgi:hypothetical protein